MRSTRTLLARLAGLAIFGLSLYFLIERLVANREDISALASGSTIMLIVATAGGYACALGLLAWSWGALVTGRAVRGYPYLPVVRVYGRSQILKYLPSNLLPLAGRQVLGARQGWTQMSLAAASVMEALLMTLVAGLLTLTLGGSVVERIVPRVSSGWLMLAAAILLAGLLFLPSALPRLPWPRLDQAAQDLHALTIGWRLPAILAALLSFYALCGFLLWTLAGALGRASDAAPWTTLTGAFATAWLAGFLAPGVPAGLGVREAVLLLLLPPAMGDAATVSVTLAMRLTTTLGDLLFFCVAQVLEVRARSKKHDIAPASRHA